MGRRYLAALICLLALCAAACAAESAGQSASPAPEQLTLTVGPLNFRTLNASSDEGLETLNAFLAPLAARVSVRQDGARLAFLADGQEIAAADAADLADTAALPTDALYRLFDEALPALYEAALPQEAPPEPTLRRAQVKNVGLSTQRTAVQVTSAQLEAFRPALEEAVAALSAHLPHAGNLRAWAAAMQPVGDLTLTRLEDEAGAPVAWQLTGRIASGGQDTRQLTFYGGVHGLDAYISLKLPARSGRNSLQWVVDLNDRTGGKENTLTGTITYKRAMNGDSYTVKDTVDLRAAPGALTALSGSVRRECTAGGVKSVWTAAPSLTGDGRTLAGTVSLTRKYAQTQVWQAVLNVSLSTEPLPVLPAPLSLPAFTQALTRYFADTRAALSPERRRLLDHTLRTDAWMYGPAR